MAEIKGPGVIAPGLYVKKTIIYWLFPLVAGLVLISPAIAVESSPDADEALPEMATGAFVQRKVLVDVGVTLVSKGHFRFEKGRFFEWTTIDPVKSVFLATPTNYVITVNGRATARTLSVDVTSVAKVFEIKEMKEYVESVKTVPEVGFPRDVQVKFKNGDRLEVELSIGEKQR